MAGRSMLPALILGLAIAPGTAGCVSCPAALLTGVLAEQAGELVVLSEGGNPVERVIWPGGYGVRKDSDMLVVTDIFGSIKAREGDFVRLGGGEADDGLWKTCGMFEVGPTPTT